MPRVPYVSTLLLVTLLQGATSSCARAGVDYPGADLWNAVVHNIDMCTAICGAVRYCKSVTYRSSDRRCFLKFRRGGSTGPVLTAGLTSVNKVCDNTRDQSCAHHNVDYGGADMGMKIAYNFDQCEQLCRDTERCKSITYVPSNKNCFMKYQFSGTRGPTGKAGLISLNMKCPTAGVQHSRCAYHDMDFPGADLTGLVTEKNDVGKCEKFCEEAPLCVSFTYTVRTGACYLKSRMYGDGPRNKAGDISMNMNCSKK